MIHVDHFRENFKGRIFGSPLKIICEYGLKERFCPSERIWLPRVEREQYHLHVKDNLADFEKEQANASTRQHSDQQSGEGL